MLRSNLQYLGLAAVVVALAGGVELVRHGLKTHGIPFSYAFLRDQAGFDISQGLTITTTAHGLALQPFTAADSNLQALIAGVFNTLVAAIISIVLTTILGVLVGVGRLSSNWIIRQWAFFFVELIRNTPLLVQLAFWYFAVLVQLPPLSAAFVLPGHIVASQRGLYFPAPHLSHVAGAYAWFVLSACAPAVGIWLLRRSRLWVLSLGVAAVALLVIGAATVGTPVVFDEPVISRFRVAGGIGITPEMTALVVALVVNTAASIAEIVRGAIQSVSKGQWEAAASLGLGQGEALRIIILPQAVRVIIPSLGNQYVSLAKSTSLGIAIGFPDLFNVYGTVANQTGRSLEGILIVMLFYLMISFGISGLTNAYNRRIVRRGART